MLFRRGCVALFALVLLLAAPAAADEHVPTVAAEIPEVFVLGEPGTISVTATNDGDDDITEAVLSFTVQIPGGSGPDDVSARLEVTGGEFEGTTDEFETSVNAVLASASEDFTLAAGETIQSEVAVTFDEAPVEAGYQMEVALVGEVDGETVSDQTFAPFEIQSDEPAQPDTPADDVDDRDEADDREVPVDGIDAGAGGAATGGALPFVLVAVTVTLLGAGMLLLRRRTA